MFRVIEFLRVIVTLRVIYPCPPVKFPTRKVSIQYLNFYFEFGRKDNESKSFNIRDLESGICVRCDWPGFLA